MFKLKISKNFFPSFRLVKPPHVAPHFQFTGARQPIFALKIFASLLTVSGAPDPFIFFERKMGNDLHVLNRPAAKFGIRIFQIGQIFSWVFLRVDPDNFSEKLIADLVKFHLPVAALVEPNAQKVIGICLAKNSGR